MDFSKLSEYPVTKTFEAKDASGRVVDSCLVTFDVNKYSGELDRRMGSLYAERVREFDAAFKLRAAQARKKKGKRDSTDLLTMADDFQKEKELDARLSDIRKEILADSLASDRYGLIRAWEMEAEGVHVPPTFENMMRLPEAALEDLLNLGRRAGGPKSVEKKATGRQKGTTSSTSDSGAREKSTIRQLDGPPN
jgi:hypothetical protein